MKRPFFALCQWTIPHGKCVALIGKDSCINKECGTGSSSRIHSFEGIGPWIAEKRGWLEEEARIQQAAAEAWGEAADRVRGVNADVPSAGKWFPMSVGPHALRSSAPTAGLP